MAEKKDRILDSLKKFTKKLEISEEIEVTEVTRIDTADGPVYASEKKKMVMKTQEKD